MTDPTLSINYLLTSKDADSDAELPQLPAELPIVSAPTRLTGQPSQKLFCETCQRSSPFHGLVLENSRKLLKTGDSWCS